jgi:hypothetical protein
MACLSILKDKVYVVCANPIFPTSDLGNTLAFEVLENDASSLKSLLGEADEYYIDSVGTFFGVLQSLEPRQSTHPGLAMLRDKTTLHGVMQVHKTISLAKH